MMTRSTFYRQSVQLLALLFCIFPAQHLIAETRCDDLASLNGLIGEWQAQNTQQSVVEIWQRQADDSLKGISRTLGNNSSKRPFEESLRIVKMSGEIFYLAKTPQNSLPVAFRLVECSHGRLRFENPKHDFPQVISYQVSQGKLSVSVFSNTDKGFSLNYALQKPIDMTPVKDDKEAIVAQYVKSYQQKDIQGMSRLMHPQIRWLSVKEQQLSLEVSGKNALIKAMRKTFNSSGKVESALLWSKALGGFVSAFEKASWPSQGEMKSQCSPVVYQLKDDQILNVWYFPATNC